MNENKTGIIVSYAIATFFITIVLFYLSYGNWQFQGRQSDNAGFIGFFGAIGTTAFIIGTIILIIESNIFRGFRFFKAAKQIFVLSWHIAVTIAVLYLWYR